MSALLCGGASHGDLNSYSHGDVLSKEEASLNTLRGVGKRVAEVALRMAASAK